MDQSRVLLAPAATLSNDDLAAQTFLARYSGATRETYRYGLKKFFGWCAANNLRPLEAKRPILELFIRWMEDQGTSRATIAHQFGVVRGFFEYAEIDEYIARSPARSVRVPRVWADDSVLVGLDRLELGSLIHTARAANPTEWALVVLMAMLGLRVSEACSIQVESFQSEERGHRVLKFTGKGGKPATIPLPVPVARALDAAAGERTTGPLLLRQTGQRKGDPHTRESVPPVLRRLAKKAGITKHIHPHLLRHAFVAIALDAGVPLRDVQIAARHSDPRTTARYDRARFQLDRHAVHTVSAYLAGAS